MDASQTILDDALRRIAQLERDVESRRNDFHEKRQSHQTKGQNRRSVIRDYSSSSRYTTQQASRNSQYRGYVRRRYSSSSSSRGTTRSSRSRSGEKSIRNSEHNDGERIARRTTLQETNPGERHPRGTTRESGNSPDNINRSSNLPSESASGAGIQHVYSGTSPMSPGPEEGFPDSMLAYIGPNITALSQGLKIGQPIADNWLALARSGLPKENVDELLGKYPIPENCPGLGGPALNPELKLTLAPQAIKKDSYQLALQNQLGAALSALGQAFSKTLRRNKQSHQCSSWRHWQNFNGFTL
ncbi:uncharacterized protein LOC128864677 [Anastrepha ludens]|uniref:uncharacterized protein LOC128864677 n=1 Tax=Anastrepha ludens TaxID=28586 RepID=UPI0023B15248|nr:uncharacterized protein LOC128864677 [Anastrepha ludens]